MNFPEMPFDESMFESNELMRTYWERSTQERDSMDSESLRVEQYMPEDLAELSSLSSATYDALVVGATKRIVQDAVVKPLMADVAADEPVAAAPVEPVAPLSFQAFRGTPSGPGPFNDNANQTFWVSLVSVLVFLILAYVASRRY